MHNASIFDCFNLHDPAGALAAQFELPRHGHLFQSINLLWDYFQDKFISGRHHLTPAAYIAAETHIGKCIDLMKNYADDYDFTPAEHGIALAVLIAAKEIDSWQTDYQDLLSDDVIDILTFMHSDKNLFMIPSEAKSDRTLAFSIGLRVLSSIDDNIQTHRKPFNARNAEQDLHYAFRILNDRPEIETDLTRDCRAQAKTLIDLLKGRSTFHKPIVVYERKPGQP